MNVIKNFFENNLHLSIKNKIFFIFTTVILLSVTIVGYFGYNSASNAYINSALALNTNITKAKVIEMEESISFIPADIDFIANSFALHKYLSWKSIGETKKMNSWRNAFDIIIKDFMNKKNVYYKMRFLDIDGKEIMSYSYDKNKDTVTVIEDKNLQDKKNRDYFKKAILLNNGEYFLSEMNLNIENKKIEVPFIPVLRYSTPIVDKNGEKKGVLVFNLFADELLKLIHDLEEIQDDRDYYLLDKNADYLYHKNHEYQWGTQLGTNYNFKQDFKGVWEKFNNHEAGTFMLNGEIFSFKKVHPIHNISEEKYWYFVSKISSSNALSDLQEFKVLFVLVLVSVLLIAFALISSYINKIVRPLMIVSNQLKALAKGEIKKEEIDYKYKDEVGQIVNSTTILIDAIETTIIQANAVASGNFSKEIQLLSKNDQLGLALQNMRNRLKEIASLSNQLASGDYDVTIIAKSSEDELGFAILDMVEYLEHITQIVESISIGNVDVKNMVKSEKDRLGLATLDMVEYLKLIVRQANSISNNDLSHNIEVKSNNDALGLALGTMTDLLRTNDIKNKNEIWFSESVRFFTDKLVGISDPIKLSTVALSLCSRYVNASNSILYSFEKESSILSLQASFSLVIDEHTIKSCALGEGVLGQVALEKEAILLSDLDDSSFSGNTGIKNLQSKEIFIFPLLHADILQGVIKMHSIKGFTEIEKDYLNKTSQILATSLFTTIQNLQIKNLLEKSQLAYEELEVKSEEMQTQSEELRASNEQMEEQALQLQIQSDNLHIKNKEIEKAKLEIDKRADELENSNQYKSEFLANMSHELRTPLNSVILLSSLLTKNNKRNLTTSDLEKVGVINESGNELLRLINDILDLSKIESGKMELIIDKIDSNKLLKSYNEVFSHSAKERNLVLNIHDNFNDFFYTDKDRLNQIVRNLISNALKFTKEGTLDVTISKSSIKQLPIIIEVKDTGIGIAPHKQELIFKAFMQADGSTNRKFGGTGLGLSISKELAQLMGGKIELHSVENEGSAFKIYLPNLVDQYNENEITDNSKEVEISKNIESDNKNNLIINKKIKPHVLTDQFLIIEDDISFANIIKNIIEDQGFKAFIANTGKEGIALALEHHIHGAIIDLGLPDMNGIEVIKVLKSNHLTEDIHIQVITGKEIKDIDFADIQVDGYLQKPVSSNQIIKTINSIESQQDVQTKSILLVEDDIVHLNALKDYLCEEKDYDIITTQSVEEAIKVNSEKYFDLAIIDLGLSDGSGIEICQKLSESRKDTVILIYTGRDLSLEETDYLNDISDEIIIKNPNSHLRLRDEITRFLESPSLTVNKKFMLDIQNISLENKLNLKNKRVLIVDDDMKNIFVLSSALQEYDMEISHAKNGKDALTFLSNNKNIDIILMDIMMPIMDGYECMKEIRLDTTIKHLPIIAVTAKAMPKDKQKALECGADDYLTKPIDLEKLQAMMLMWINK
ncbi:response regulator [Arcobacteraceae bacterium]|nr:response regulator [Arcobacteraceae bacterium]